ncbi:hypothetical protein SADUNF_Sadunf04G0039100 [Salix dunnii]|uniref:Uncharacterized protein n=1 Tax=Salix dunnii TaxID=1413687 RepID=A0A835KAE3_9ROSI|nr:hypothetical protein SADUNF_Sadunf04G0039100 [Salix dunnii]
MIDLHYQQPLNDIEENTLNDDNAMATEAEAAADCRNSTPKGLLRPLTRQKKGSLKTSFKVPTSLCPPLVACCYAVCLKCDLACCKCEYVLFVLNNCDGQVAFRSILFVQATPASFENLGPTRPGEINDTTNESEAVNTEGANEVPAEGVNPLDKFLPPPPKEKFPEEFQAIIDEIGSCFSKDVFDSHGYDQSDYYLEIEADMRRERDRKDQELKRSPKVEFVTGITRPGVAVPPTKFSMPIPVVTASRMRPSSNAAPCEVDDDGRNLLSGGQDSLAAAAAQAAIISAANVGSGYTQVLCKFC